MERETGELREEADCRAAAILAAAQASCGEAAAALGSHPCHPRRDDVAAGGFLPAHLISHHNTMFQSNGLKRCPDQIQISLLGRFSGQNECISIAVAASRSCTLLTSSIARNMPIPGLDRSTHDWVGQQCTTCFLPSPTSLERSRQRYGKHIPGFQPSNSAGLPYLARMM